MSNIIQQGLEFKESKDYFSKHLEIISPFLPTHLTRKEVEVLGLFMSFEETNMLNRFHTEFRKIVRKELSLSHSGLSGHIKNLVTKGAILEGLGEILTIKEFLFPKEGEQFYQFKIKMKV